METRERQQTAAERITQINRTLDTINENKFNLLGDINYRACVRGWSDRLVERGLDAIDEMERRIAELQEERRQLRQQPTARAS